MNIHEAMSTCRDLFIRFGGHAQAAGLTIEAKNVPEFKRRLSEAIREQAAPEAFIPTEEYDLELELSEITEAFVDAFSAMQRLDLAILRLFFVCAAYIRQMCEPSAKTVRICG